jgi:hypothetical protein
LWVLVALAVAQVLMVMLEVTLLLQEEQKYFYKAVVVKVD